MLTLNSVYKNTFPLGFVFFSLYDRGQRGDQMDHITDKNHIERFKDIPESQNWKQIQQVEKGWSSDQKYHIVTEDGQQLLMRVASIDDLEAKKQEYTMMRRLDTFDFQHSRPFAIGRCQEGVYTLFNWIEGGDLESELPQKSVEMQYRLGVQSGRILRQIHTIEPQVTSESWEVKFNRKLDRKLMMYQQCELKYQRDDALIAYIEATRPYLQNRPMTLHHGDYHVGNMILCGDDAIGVIDFNRYDYGDPWEEFNRIVWDVDVSHAFATGKIDGYFDGEVPELFFRLLALYIASNTLSSLPWAIPFGEGEIQTMRRQAEQVLRYYDDFKNIVPSWYQGHLKSRYSIK